MGDYLFREGDERPQRIRSVGDGYIMLAGQDLSVEIGTGKDHAGRRYRLATAAELAVWEQQESDRLEEVRNSETEI